MICILNTVQTRDKLKELGLKDLTQTLHPHKYLTVNLKQYWFCVARNGGQSVGITYIDYEAIKQIPILHTLRMNDKQITEMWYDNYPTKEPT